ncbi:MAG: DEDD exonuclease domain-containing protein [Chloroherpetonaceae bacterium]|nr:DEDD exonuclease domain-containing protein [Chloroherpetonaceae bacterium]
MGKSLLNLDLPFRDIPFTVIDLETTGGVKPENTIIEVSAFQFIGGRITGEYTTLVNPLQPISYFISEYTGITNEMVKEAPTMKQIIGDLRHFIGESIFVAHNIGFDFGFVNLELSRYGLKQLENPTLCTVRLARRLTPKNQRKNLGALAAYFGVELKNRHRARGDSLATVYVLDALMRLASHKFDAETAQELLSLQFQSIRKFRRETRFIKTLRETTLRHLPETPGVYLMYSESGNLLYVGKSKNLKARINSYFNGPDHHSEKVKELVKQIAKIETRETGSELEALIEESRLIKSLSPPYNTLLRFYRRYPFLKLSSDDFSRLDMALELENDGAEYFGPFTSKEITMDVFESINKHFKLRECSDSDFRKGRACIYKDLNRCIAPCESPSAMLPLYQKEVAKVKDFLSGNDSQILGMLTEKMKALGAEQRYEEAGELRDKIQSLRRVFYRQANVISSVNENNLLIFLPTSKKVKNETGSDILVLVVRFGRLVRSFIYLQEDLEKECQSLFELFFNGENAPEECKNEEIDEMQILSTWIFQNRESLSCLYITSALSVELSPASLSKAIQSRISLYRQEGQAKASRQESIQTILSQNENLT